VDEDPLPGPDVGGVDEGLIGGEGGEREGACLDVVDAGRLVDEGAGRGGHVLRMRANPVRVGQHAEDLIARLEQGDAQPDGLHDPRDVPAQDQGQAFDGRHLSAVLPVGRADPGRADGDQDLAQARLGPGSSISLSTSGETYVSWPMARIVA